jgi:AraC family transcriptional regulator
MSDQSRRSEAAKGKPSMPEPQIVQRGAFLVAGLHYEGKNEHGEIPALWDNEFLPRIGELAGIRVGREAYGMMRVLPGVPAEQGFEYLASVEVRSLENLPRGMVGWEIPAQTYAVLPAHDVPDLGRAFDDLYVRWLPQSGYEATDGPMFELYPATYGQDLIIYVYAAVRRK